MSALLIQLTDKEFKEVLSEAYKDGYKKAIEETTEIKEWLTEEETLEALYIAPSTLATWRHNRRITYRGKRGNFQYSKADIDRIIEEHTINRV